MPEELKLTQLHCLLCGNAKHKGKPWFPDPGRLWENPNYRPVACPDCKRRDWDDPNVKRRK